MDEPFKKIQFFFLCQLIVFTYAVRSDPDMIIYFLNEKKFATVMQIL